MEVVGDGLRLAAEVVVGGEDGLDEDLANGLGEDGGREGIDMDTNRSGRVPCWDGRWDRVGLCD